jgi:hypothetical protein
MSTVFQGKIKVAYYFYYSKTVAILPQCVIKKGQIEGANIGIPIALFIP